MRAFHFRLDQALRWRAAQLDLEKSRASLAAGVLQGLQSETEERRSGLINGGRQLSSDGCTGSSLVLWAGFSDQARREIKELDTRSLEAARVLAAQMQVVIEANQRMRLLENLKRSKRDQWQSEINRELDAFAGESYLFGLQSRNRARSSGG